MIRKSLKVKTLAWITMLCLVTALVVAQFPPRPTATSQQSQPNFRSGPTRDPNSGRPSGNDASRNGPVRTGPSRGEPTRSAPTRIGPTRGGPRRGGPSRGGPSWGGRRMPLRSDFPTWEVEPEFEHDVFTFVRIKYDSFGSFGWWSRWDNDYPDGDWNFSFRLQQLTSLKVALESKALRLTDPELLNHPFAYMAGVGKMELSQTEQEAMRRYLLNGGFIMMDDFWSPEQIRNVKRVMDSVLPNGRPRELTIDHPIFHNVYDLKQLPQVVDIKTWSDGYSYEFRHGYSGGDEGPHFWAYHDDHGRMVALLCHNNDLGDGWEREGENHEYFLKFSEKLSYPLGINIVTYAMTH